MIFSRRIFEAVYQVQVTLLVGSGEDLRAWMEARFTLEELRGMNWQPAQGKVIERDDAGRGCVEWFLWLPAWTPDDQHIGVLAHESLHLTSRILRSHGLTLTHESEEAFTYYLESLFLRLLIELRAYERAQHRQRRPKPRRRGKRAKA